MIFAKPTYGNKVAIQCETAALLSETAALLNAMAAGQAFGNVSGRCMPPTAAAEPRLTAAEQAALEDAHARAAVRGDTQMFVKKFDGKTHTFDLYLDETVYVLKARVEARMGVPISEQRLIFVGLQLGDDRTLADSGIRKWSTVDLVLRQRGC